MRRQRLWRRLRLRPRLRLWSPFPDLVKLQKEPPEIVCWAAHGLTNRVRNRNAFLNSGTFVGRETDFAIGRLATSQKPGRQECSVAQRARQHLESFADELLGGRKMRLDVYRNVGQFVERALHFRAHHSETGREIFRLVVVAFGLNGHDLACQ